MFNLMKQLVLLRLLTYRSKNDLKTAALPTPNPKPRRPLTEAGNLQDTHHSLKTATRVGHLLQFKWYEPLSK